MKDKSVLTTAWVALTTLWSASALGVENFAKGHGALQTFDAEGFAAMPLVGKLWLVFLVSGFLAGLIFVRKGSVARWVVGGFLVSLVTGHMVFAALSLPMLGGSIAIWHVVCWTPALMLLLAQRPFFDPNEGLWYRIWSSVMTCVVLISFVFDIRSAAIYIDHFSD